jgi:hypothetical protein
LIIPLKEEEEKEVDYERDGKFSLPDPDILSREQA